MVNLGDTAPNPPLAAAQIAGVWQEIQAHPHRRLAICPFCQARLAAVFQAASTVPEPDRSPELETARLQAALALAEYELAQRNYAAAEAYARQAAAANPWDEAAQRLVIQALAESGQRLPAVRYYLSQVQGPLQTAGLEPEAATQELLKAIRQGSLKRPAVLEAGGPGSSPPGSFWGREAELAQLQKLLVERGTRLISLVGPGGNGKTRLALEAGCAYQWMFHDGAAVISLDRAPGSQESAAAGAILAQHAAADLDLALAAGQPVDTQVRQALQGREMLLVVDNLEHLQAASRLLLDWLEAAPGLTILLTSRRPLEARGEHVLRLDGLPLPARGDPQAMQYAALKLFYARSRSVQPPIQPEAAELDDLLELLGYLHGSPLAIELAAAWSERLPVAELLRQVKNDLQVLQAPELDWPERHRSLKIVFEASWRNLEPRQQELLAELTLWPGQIQSEAVQAVLGASPGELARLYNHSLLHSPRQGVYTLHRTVRQSTIERRAQLESQGRLEIADLQARFATWYLQRLEQDGEQLFGPRPYPCAQAWQEQQDALRQAWQWAVSGRDWPLLERACPALLRLYLLTGLFSEGEADFEAAAEAVAQAPPSTRQERDLQAMLTLAAAYSTLRIHPQEDPKGLIRRAQEQAAASGSLLLLAGAFLVEAQSLHARTISQCRPYYEQALVYARQAYAATAQPEAQRVAVRAMIGLDFAISGSAESNQVALAQALRLGDAWLEIEAAHQLSISHTLQGHYALARQSFESLLVRFDWLPPDHPYRYRLIGDLANACIALGDYAAGLPLNTEAIAILRRRGDQHRLAGALSNYASALLLAGETERAGQVAEEGLQYAVALNLHNWAVWLYLTLGYSHLALGAPAAAYPLFKQALEQVPAGNLFHELLECRTALAQAALDLEQPDLAQQHAEEALRCLADTPPGLTGELLLPLARLGLVLYHLADPRAGQVQARAQEVFRYQRAAIPLLKWRELFEQEAAVRLLRKLEVLLDQAGQAETLPHDLPDEISARWKTLLEISQDAILLTNQSGMIYACNERVEELFGYGQAELLNQPLHKLVPEGLRSAQRRYRKGAYAGAKNIRIGKRTVYGLHKDGHELSLQISFTPLEIKEYLSFIVMLQPVEVESEGSQQILMLSAALESAGHAVAISDLSGVCLWVNPAFTQLTGYTAQEISGRSLSLLKSGLHDRDFYTQLWQTIQAGETWQGEITNRHKDGHLYTEQQTIAPVRDSRGAIVCYVAIKQNVSQQRRLEADLLAANQRLQEQLEAIEQLQVQLQEQANRDPLTGAYNRRYLNGMSAKLLAEARAAGQPLGLIVLDLDHFKKVNDTYGHLAGDAALRSVVEALQRQSGSAAIVCRFGGEEFVLLLPGSDLSKTLAAAADLLEGVRRLLVCYQEHCFSVTFSAGVAAFPQHGDTLEALLHHADEALYRAKRQGRDRVYAAGGG